MCVVGGEGERFEIPGKAGHAELKGLMGVFEALRVVRVVTFQTERFLEVFVNMERGIDGE